jgi:hypothetical protein
MTVNAAYDILGLSHNASARDLVLAYRTLVKRFHPDYNADKEAWSTEKMTDLNIAYETARAFIASQGEPRGAGGPGRDQRSDGGAAAGRDPGGQRAGTRRAAAADPAAGARAYTERPFGPALSPQFSRLFDKPWQFVVDGVYVFYQYGLENVHLRQQGVHRFRYRQAVKNIKDGIAGLEPLDEDVVTATDTKRLSAARGFSKAFLQNMLIEKYYIPSRAGIELKAYNHYKTGARHLDRAIKRRFCRELEEPYDPPAGAGTLEVVQHELITVIAKYTDSTWVPESMIKMHLLDRFNAVVEAELSA